MITSQMPIKASNDPRILQSIRRLLSVDISKLRRQWKLFFVIHSFQWMVFCAIVICNCEVSLELIDWPRNAWKFNVYFYMSLTKICVALVFCLRWFQSSQYKLLKVCSTEFQKPLREFVGMSRSRKFYWSLENTENSWKSKLFDNDETNGLNVREWNKF